MPGFGQEPFGESAFGGAILQPSGIIRSAMLDRLLAALPAYLDKEPRPAPAIQLAYTLGGATLTIARHRLRTRVDSGTGAPLDIDLSSHTLTSLVTLLAAQPGYTATLLAADGTVGAASLIDAKDLPLQGGARLDAFTALLWALFVPLAWALEDALDQAQAGLRQMSLKGAEGPWIDVWGDLYGGVRRALDEADRPYADRIVTEATRWRLNGKAIEQIVAEDLGFAAEVTNLHDQAWVVARTKFGRLAGRKHSRTTFEVLVDALSDRLAALVDRNRAAGTLPFYRYRLTGGLAPEPQLAESPTKVSTLAPMAPNRVWTVSLDRLGERPLAVPRAVGAHVTTIVRVVEQGGAAANAFSLGQSQLGAVDMLGDAVNPAIALTDAASEPSSPALDFDGTSGYISIADQGLLDLTTAFTIEFWIYRRATAETRAVLAKHDVGLGSTNAYMVLVKIDGGLRYETDNQTPLANSTGTIQLQTWQHVAVVFDNGTVDFYIDGATAGQVTGVPAPVANARTLLIGRTGTGSFLSAILDEVRIFNTARTPAQVAADALARFVSAAEPGLVAYWKADEGSGGSVANEVSGGNAGTISGGVTWGTRKPA